MSEPSTTSIVTDERAHPRMFEIFIDGTKYETSASILTGAQLKELAGIPAANHLFLELPGHGEDQQILDSQQVELKSGMHFYDVPVGNLGVY